MDAGRLLLDVEYSRRLHRPASIERFADGLRSALREVAAAQPPAFAMVDQAALSRVASMLAELDDA